MYLHIDQYEHGIPRLWDSIGDIHNVHIRTVLHEHSDLPYKARTHYARDTVWIRVRRVIPIDVDSN